MLPHRGQATMQLILDALTTSLSTDMTVTNWLGNAQGQPASKEPEQPVVGPTFAWLSWGGKVRTSSSLSSVKVSFLA